MKQEHADLLKKAHNNKDVKTLCKALFNVKLYPTQEEIVRDIAFSKERRMVLNTYTRYGKTYAVGIGLALYIVLKRKMLDNFRIGILGPTVNDANRVRKEFLKAGIESETFKEMLDMSHGNDAEDLVKSRSKSMLTFDDGNIELHCLSAQSGRSGDGSGVMGDGVDILIMDESNRISHEFWKQSGNRLLEHEDAVLIEMGNPTHKDNQFYSHWVSSEFQRYHVGEQKGIKENRHTKGWFDEKASEYSSGRDSIDYKILYKSEFPDQVENSLIRHSWIEHAKTSKVPELENPGIVYSADVADEGDDFTVLSRLETEKNVFVLTDQWVLKDSSDTGLTAKWIDKKIQSKGEGPKQVNGLIVDYVGIGAGVWSKLKEIGYNPYKFKAGSNPLAEKDRFLNKKARCYFKVRNALQEKDLYFRKGFSHGRENKLVHELTHIKTDRSSRDRIKIVDPDSGSPDFADSLMMGFYRDFSTSSDSSSGSISMF